MRRIPTCILNLKMFSLRLFLFAVISVLAVAQHDKEPIVRIGHGVLQGIWKISNRGRTYGSFEGIPYARPPVGKYRFRVSKSQSTIYLLKYLFICIILTDFSKTSSALADTSILAYIDTFNCLLRAT